MHMSNLRSKNAEILCGLLNALHKKINQKSITTFQYSNVTKQEILYPWSELSSCINLKPLSLALNTAKQEIVMKWIYLVFVHGIGVALSEQCWLCQQSVMLAWTGSGQARSSLFHSTNSPLALLIVLPRCFHTQADLMKCSQVTEQSSTPDDL